MGKRQNGPDKGPGVRSGQANESGHKMIGAIYHISIGYTCYRGRVEAGTKADLVIAAKASARAKIEAARAALVDEAQRRMGCAR